MASTIVQRDIKILFSDSFLVAIMFANFAIDLFVTAATFGRLVPPSSGIPSYFQFIAPGSNFVTASVAAFQSGRRAPRIPGRTVRSRMSPCISTTNRYIEIDLAMKAKALQTCEVTSPNAGEATSSCSPDILAWLESL